MHIALRILIWTLAAIFVLLAGAFVYLRNADLSVYETQIEGALSDAIGHKIDFDGLFELQVRSLTRITAEDVVVTNPAWTTAPELLTIGHLSVTVDTWSLLSPPIIIQDLELDDTHINFEEDASGATNWDADSVSEAASGEEAGEFDLQLVAFRSVRVKNFNIRVDEPDRAQPLNVGLDRLTVNPDASGVLDLQLRGAVDEYPLSADGKIGPWRNFITGRNLTVDLKVALARLRLDLRGSVEDLRALQGMEISSTLQGPAIDRVIGTFGLPEFAAGEFMLEAELRQEGPLNKVRLSGNLGEIDVKVNATIDDWLDIDKAALEFDLSGPDTLHFAEVFGIKGAPAVPFDVSGNISLDYPRFEFAQARAQLGENQVNLGGWLDLDKKIPDGSVTVSASGPNLAVIESFAGVRGIPPLAFDISGHVEKSGRSARFDNVAANIGQNKITANGAIGPDGGDGTEISISMAGPDISVIEALAGLPEMPDKPYSISAFLRPDPIGINLDDARLLVGDNQLEIDGIIGTLDGVNGTRINLHGFGPDLLNVSLLTGIPYMPQGAYDYVADINIDNAILNIDKFDLTVVGATVSANGKVDIGDDSGDFELQIAASSDDVSQLELFASLKELAGEALRLRGKVGSEAGVFTLTAVTADIGNLGIAMNGEFGLEDAGAKLTFSATAPDAVLLDRFLPDQQMPAGPILVNGQIEKYPEAIRFTDTSARIGDFSLSIDGLLNTSPLSNSSDLTFSFSGADLYNVGEIAGLKTLPKKSFSVAANVNGIPTGFAIENIVANIGDNDIAGKFAADLRGKPRVTGSLSASYLDVASQIEATAPAAAKANPGPYVIPDEPLPFDWFNALDADIELRVARLILTQLSVKDFHIDIAIDDGAFRADPISLGEDNGKISGHVHVSPRDDTYDFDTLINIENIHVGINESADSDRSTLPALNGTIRLLGKGKSAHQIMATSNGRVSLSQGPGQTSNVMVSRLFGDLVSQIIQAINPLKTVDKYTSLECAFYEVGIENGVATIDEFVMQTDKVTMAAEGSIAFADEALKLSVSAKPRKGIGISVGGIANSFLNVRGTLKKPALGIDTVGSMTTGGVAVATGGLSLVAKGLWDRVQAENSICDRVNKDAR